MASSDFVCVRCRSSLRADEHGLSCGACGQRAPVVATIPILTLRADTLLADVFSTLEGAARQFERGFGDPGFGEPGFSPGLARRVERWRGGVQHNLDLLREHLHGVAAYVSALEPRPPGLLDWVASQAGGWWPGQMWPYFFQDWSGSREFARVAALVDRALEQYAPDRRRGVVLGAGACGLVWSAASRFDRVAGLDLSVPALLLARGLLSGAAMEFHLDRAEWQRVRVRCPEVRAGIDLAIADANALPFGEGTQSAVVTQYLMDLVGNPLHVADEIRRVLVSGGVWVNFSRPFFLPGEPADAGPPALPEIVGLLHARGWHVPHAVRERFTLTSLEAIHDGGDRFSHEVHFFAACKTDGPAPALIWSDAADWREWRVRATPGRSINVGPPDGAHRVTVRVGGASVPAEPWIATAMAAVARLIDGHRTIADIAQAPEAQPLCLTEPEWRELFHYLADCYGVVQLLPPSASRRT